MNLRGVLLLSANHLEDVHLEFIHLPLKASLMRDLLFQALFH